MKVNANTLRSGHVIEHNGHLFAVIRAENIQPGKGTPVTQLELRRISDGIKTTERYRTQETVERVFIDERDFSYLFADGESLTFMDQENFEQVSVSKDIVGDQAAYLQEGMICQIKLHEGNPVAITIPDKVTLEITETEPVVKGQTAANSYKPAILENGARVMVPPFISSGTKIVVSTVDGSYIERAKE